MGTGHLDAFGFLQGDEKSGRAGVELDAEGHLSANVAAFAKGWAGDAWGDTGNHLDFGGLAGLRMRF